MHYILGASGAGKSALVAHLSAVLPERTILDWDSLMEAAGRLAGRDVRTNAGLWQPYAELMRDVVGLLPADRVILLTVCTPDQLMDWPEGAWFLLECDDAERRKRLESRGEPSAVIETALADAQDYRDLGLARIETTNVPLEMVARQLAEAIGA
jgi:energy-coupling factor transporter ATP-binding protein EcfA2